MTNDEETREMLSRASLYDADAKIDKKVFCYFDGGYGRIGEIKVVKSTCYKCGRETLCLHSDACASAEEYSPAIICLDCIEKAFGVGT